MLIIVIGLVILVAIVYIVIYNGLVNKQTDIDDAWSQIDVQLKRRNDLIPNLVNTVKGYAHFESNTLQQVIKYRGQMVHIDPSQKGTTPQQVMNISNQLSGALKSLFAVSERYPELHANEDFKKLMDELSNTEDRIAYSRQHYNDSVATFDASIRKFPANMVTGSKFTKRKYLKTPDNEKAVPKVNFK